MGSPPVHALFSKIRIREVNMKKRSLTVLLATAIVLALMCSCQENTMQPAGTGRTLYMNKCSSCHNLIQPAAFSAGEWAHYIDEYGKKMTSIEKNLLLNYLTTQ